MNNFIFHLFNKIRHYRLAFAIALLFLLVLSFFSIRRFHFEEKINNLAPNSPEIVKMSTIFAHSSLMDKIVVSIDNSKYPEADKPIIEAADSIVNYLSSSGFNDIIKELKARIPQKQMMQTMDFMLAHLPLFLEKTDYVLLDSLIQYQSIDQSINADYKVLMTPANFGFKSFIQRDPLSFSRIVTAKLNKLRQENGFQLVDSYIFTADKSKLLLFVELKNSQNTDLVNRFDNKLKIYISGLKNNPQFKSLNITYFGGPLVAASNANQIKKDIILTVSLALILLLVLISYYFHSKRAIFIIFVPTMLGAVFSLAIISLVQPSISLISLGVGSVLMGISIDYALHIFGHYRRNQNLEKLFEEVSQPILISALTTSAAFFSLMALQSKVISDLGMFLGLSILFSALFSLFLFPLLLPSQIKQRNKSKRNFIDRIASYDVSKKSVAFIAVIIISIVFLLMNHESRFTSDLSANNYMSADLRKSEKAINSLIGLDSNRNMFVAAEGNSLQEALRKNEKLGPLRQQIARNHLSNFQINSASFCPSDSLQQLRIQRWNTFWTSQRKQQLKKQIIASSSRFGFRPNAFSKFYQWLNTSPTLVTPRQNPLYHQFVKDFVVNADGKTYVLSQLNVEKNRNKQQEIIELVKRANVQIVDKLYFTQLLLNKLKHGFDKLALYSLALVFLILLISYGRIELALISFAPVSLSWLWILAGMDFFGLEFNIFNVIILSFVFGLGIDYSVFYLRTMILEHKYGDNQSETYRASILIGALTSIIGIGVLIFAKHPAMRSIAATSIIGIVTIVLITFIFIPVAFRWLTQWKMGKRQKVVTFFDVITSSLFFSIYVTGAFTLTILVPFFILFPAPKKQKKLFYHHLVRFFSAHIFLHPTIPIKIINKHKEKFKSAAIIISNHQSVIDIMLMLLLHPKILIVTNERVWKHWLWGAILRYADYYPAFAGYENMMVDIRSKVLEGYSLMIFPEGTRSIDGKIKRFHKGAFMMAKELDLPILPIMLHGVNETLRKGEFFLFSGKITLNIMERIPLEELPYHQSVSAVAKKMTTFYRSEYEKLRMQVAGVDYYKIQLTRNFIYKGPVLEWYFRVKFGMEKRYRNFNQWIPREAKIIDLGCGYGFLDLMLAMISPKREIIGVDFDEEKILLAQNSAIRRPSLNFVTADVSKYVLQKADVFLILDTLHYLSAVTQKKLIQRCVKQLNPGGIIIIRDANTDREEKHKSTELTEKVSTGIGFNKASFSDMEFVSAKWIEQIAIDEGMGFEVLEESKRLSNIIYRLSKQ